LGSFIFTVVAYQSIEIRFDLKVFQYQFSQF